MLITFATAFYIIQSKFDETTYEKWFKNLIPNVRKFNLVIFCNEQSEPLLKKYINNDNKPFVKIIKLEISEFDNFQYKEAWKTNHKKNDALNGSKTSTHNTSWELNMLWSEKQSFVKRSMEIFETEWYGWMDIGYFRAEYRGDLMPVQIQHWPNQSKIEKLNIKKVHYSLVNNNPYEVNDTFQKVTTKDEYGLPISEILTYGIAGGFFLVHKNMVEWWQQTYNNRVLKYFTHNHLIKDDQNVVMDLIYNNMKDFEIIREPPGYNTWFLFQRFLF